MTSSCPDDTATENSRAPVGAQQRREHRAGVGDQRDRPGRQRVALEVADRPDAGRACRRSPCTRRRTAPSRRPPRPRRPDAVRRAEDDAPRRRPARTRARAVGASAASGTPSSTRSTGSGYVGQGRHAGPAQHAGAGRVHQVDPLVARGCAAPRSSAASRTSPAGRWRRRRPPTARPSSPAAGAVVRRSPSARQQPSGRAARGLRVPQRGVRGLHAGDAAHAAARMGRRRA